MEPPEIELNSETAEGFQHQQFATSFMVSLVTHLIVLLLFSSYWILGRNVEAIQLQASGDQAVEFDELAVELKIPNQEELLELEEPQPPDPQLPLDLFPVLEQTVEYSEPVDLAAKWASVELPEPTTPAGGSKGSAGSYFFGIRPVGERIVYIIDMSPSMQVGRYQRRYDRAVTELLNSVDQLRPDQQFFVIMFSFKTIKLRLAGNAEFCFPTDENKRKLKKRLYSIDLSSGTDPREAIVSALKLKPSCIYLLSDGEFNGVELRNGIYRDKIDAFQLSVKHNKNQCPIHTIGLEDPRTQEQLTQISKASGGTYVFVPAEY